MAAADATPIPTPVAAPAAIAAPRAVLLDLEGTTTSISFVKDKLFPYAVENVKKYLTSSWDGELVKASVEGMRQQSIKDVEEKIEGAVLIPDKEASKEDQIAAISNSLKWLISIDNKGTHMKELSGLIWQSGYEAGEIKGHLYDDVKPAIQKWKDSGKKVYIYSSGSVHAQKLLMKYSTAGDLESLLDGYFDTNVGHKRETASYKNILEKIECASEDTSFLTDIVEEGNAAKEAGINVILLSREGNAPLSDDTKEKYTVVESFADIIFPSALKRKSSPAEEETRPSKITKSELNGTVSSNGDKVEEAAVDPAPIVDTAPVVDSAPVVETAKIVEASPVVEEDNKMEVDEEVKESDPEPVEIDSKPAELEKLETNDKAESPKQIEAEVEKVAAIEKENVTLEVKKVAESEEVKVSEADTETKESEKTEEISKTSDEPMETDVSEVISENNGAVSKDTDVEKTDIKMDAAEDEKKESEDAPGEETKVSVEETKVSVEEKESDKPITEEKASEAPVANGNGTSEEKLEVTSTVEAKDESPAVETEKSEEKTIVEKIDDDKLIELIKEETVELDKQCVEIISKANNVIVITKDLVNKPSEEKIVEEDDKKQPENGKDEEIATETEKVADVVAPVVEVKSDDAPKEAVSEIPEEKPAVVEPSQDKPEDKTEKAPAVENVETKNGDSSKEMNGDEAKNGHAVNGKETNGKSDEGDEDTEKTNGTTESAESKPDTEIKVKKIATEETPPETTAEQTVET